MIALTQQQYELVVWAGLLLLSFLVGFALGRMTTDLK